jgi:hypothetical protein
MSEQAKPVGASDKMRAKDFITLGIFTVLFFADAPCQLCVPRYFPVQAEHLG